MIKREFAIFVIVGACTVLVDLMAYYSLIQFQLMEIDIAKAVGFLVGTLFAYFANRIWTFGHTSHAQGSLWRFFVLYSSTLITNVLVNSLVLHLFINTMAAFQLAFLLATLTSACLNFLGMKFFVFKPIQTMEHQ